MSMIGPGFGQDHAQLASAFHSPGLHPGGNPGYHPLFLANPKVIVSIEPGHHDMMKAKDEIKAKITDRTIRERF